MIAIQSERLMCPEGIRSGVLLIDKEKIIGIAAEIPASGIHELIDAGDALVMPGVIDPHVHINEPGRTDWEGFDTATRAALAGGITSLVDMPLNSSPVTTTLAAYQQKKMAARQYLHTDLGCWGGVVPGNEAQLEAMIDAGIPGFKAFLTHSGIDEFPNVTESDLRKAMPILARHNLPLLVHCELSDTPAPLPKTPEERRSYHHYLLSRPDRWEVDAIALMIRLSEEFNCRVHVVHLATATALPLIADAKSRGLPLTVETGQHYLYFNAEDIPDGSTAHKCAPPIRGRNNNEQIWQALESGLIDFVATDHSPAPPGMKALEERDFMKAWGGIASLQFALPVLWTAARKRNLNFARLLKWLCEHPAELIGKSGEKGKLAAGYDADITVLDERKSFRVSESMIQHRHKLTPYVGQELYGVVRQTWLRGKKVFDEGSFTALNTGTFIETDAKRI
jgi:allantoinase